MGLHLYNTASRTTEEFTPLSPEVVTMYNCGPTVYDFVHIGNLRSFLLGDLVRRVLENLVLEVRMAAGVRNTLGLKVNVALNVAERALRRFPSRDDG